MQIDAENSLGFLVSDVARLLREQFNGTAEVLGLTLAQARTLAHLSRNEGVSQVALARLLEIQPITLLRHIDRLEDAGLVRRQPNPDDRRAQQLFLGAGAEPLMEQIRVLGGAMTDIAFQGFDAEEREQVLGFLKRIKQNLAEEAAGSRS